MRSLPAILLVVALAVSGAPRAAADRLYYRDGSSEEGKVLSEHNDVYTFSGRGFGTRPVLKSTVRFVVYDDPRVAAQRLGLDDVREHCADPAPAAVDILPAEAYAAAVLDAVRQATKSIYLMTYAFSGSESGTLGEIYQALRERAAAGVKVYIIVPAGARTAAGVKISAMNQAADLADSGIQVRFLEQVKVQHKKLVIVDGRKAFVGSSNLTAAALTDNIELNISTEQPAFVAEAVKDFRSMLLRAKAAHRLER